MQPGRRPGYPSPWRVATGAEHARPNTGSTECRPKLGTRLGERNEDWRGFAKQRRDNRRDVRHGRTGGKTTPEGRRIATGSAGIPVFGRACGEALSRRLRGGVLAHPRIEWGCARFYRPGHNRGHGR